MANAFESVLRITQALIQDEIGDRPVTLELITEKVDLTLAMKPRWKEEIDRSVLIKELETRFSIWIGRETFLSSDDDHLAWLTAARQEGWRYWPRYRQWLEDRLPLKAVEALDEVSNRIVGFLEDPSRAGSWDRRGLVVGHVQSGKTANYIGVICKAADAGYKLIVILAGQHKNLRSQTQMRLDEGFLGYETMPPTAQKIGRELRTIGVGTIDSDPAIRPDYVTNRADDGDFKKAVANNMGVAPGHRPWLFVIKKNASVLRNLVSWVEEHVSNSHDSATGRAVVNNLPLLLIDDEADHASVDTGEQTFDETGKPDPDYEPKAINRLIRQLLYTFEKSAYVGYTATPFANIFIHEGGRTLDCGEDLFPRSFIISLATPSNYAGPVRVFGLDGAGDAEGRPALPLIRRVSDHARTLDMKETEGWMPPRHGNGHKPLSNGYNELPPSARDSILSFLLSCAVRRSRGQTTQHNSMLIHVTRYTNVQKQVISQVREFLENTRMRLKRGTASQETIDRLEWLWREDYLPTSHKVRELLDDDDLTVPEWDAVRQLLPLVISDVHVREINGTARDILDYETYRNTGLSVIAIGGDKLARGLTLEGLTVSYFLRATKMYDTLMQMGRWFGYRPGYLDLCRLYTTSDLEEWFGHITEASEELREEFDHMAAVGGSPRDYGLKVKAHPVLMVTSRVKMRNSEDLQLSFAGEIQETVVFHRDAKQLAANVAAAESLLKRVSSPVIKPTRERPNGGKHTWEGTRLWEGVNGEDVADFLRAFHTHEAAVKVNSRVISEYIDKQRTVGELTSWTVALLAGEGDPVLINGEQVATVKRRLNTRTYDSEAQVKLGRYVIGRLLAPRDEAIDLDLAAYTAALELTQKTYEGGRGSTTRMSPPTDPSGPSIRRIRGLGSQEMGVAPHPERGLLLLYPLTPVEPQIDFEGPIFGFGVSFPSSTKAHSVTYKVNNIYWGQEFGGELSQ